MYKKYTQGFVVQEFDDIGNPVSQEFVAEDGVGDYEDAQGNFLTEAPVTNEQYLPFDMVQPTREGESKA